VPDYGHLTKGVYIYENSGSAFLIVQIDTVALHRPTIMCPTSTLPYEVLLTLENDSESPISIQVLDLDGTFAGVTLHKPVGETVTLVLTAGSGYLYSIRQRGTEARLR
jgi:hypothetical protein